MPTQGEPNLAPEHNARRLSRHHALVIIGQCNLLVCPASNAPPQLPPSGLDEQLTAPQSGDEPQTIAGLLASKEDDPSIKAALMKFQKDHGITAMGFFGPITRTAVEAAI
jgi:hypothetical protein